VNVLIIPEDFRKDQFVLKPIVEKMFEQIGKARAKVAMCFDPLLGGIDQATKWERIADVLDMYPMVDVFLLIVDRDGVAGRRQALDGLEKKAEQVLRHERTLFAENAWQEIEVWALAGQDLPKNWSWGEIRKEIHPKESYFVKLAESRGLLDEPGQGRSTMGREAAANYKRVISRCKEDLESLQNRLTKWGALTWPSFPGNPGTK
jgi:hypothetical protein